MKGSPILVPDLSAGFDPVELGPKSKLSALLESAPDGRIDSTPQPPPNQQGSQPARQIDPRRLRQLREEYAKRRFWLAERKTDERSQEEKAVGVKEYTYENLENPSPSLDPSFEGVALWKRKPNLGRAAAGRPVESAPSSAPQDVPRYGSHASPELSLQELLAPITSANSRGSGEAVNPGLQDMLGLTPELSIAPRSSIQDNLDLPILSREGGMNPNRRDPINTSSDLSRQPLNPLIGNTARPASRAPLTAPPATLGGMSPSPGGLNNLGGPSRVTGYSSLPTPSVTPARQPPPWATAGSREPLRRRF